VIIITLYLQSFPLIYCGFRIHCDRKSEKVSALCHVGWRHATRSSSNKSSDLNHYLTSHFNDPSMLAWIT